MNITLKHFPINSILLAGVFLFLSIKGTSVIDIGNGFEITVNLPNWANSVKEYTNVIAGMLLILFSATTMRRNITRGMFNTQITSYLFVLTFYFLASFLVGSGGIENLLAILIILALSPALLKANYAVYLNSTTPEWLAALNIFSACFVFLNLLIYLMGYGYPEYDSSRYFGMTFHPNTIGTIAAISAGVFVSQYSLLAKTKLEKFVYLIFFICAAYLVIISGSRGAYLMLALAIIFSIKRSMHLIYLLAGVFLIALWSMFFLNDESPVYFAIDRVINAPSGNRDEVWQLLWEDFLASPLTGVGDRTAVSGSAYLTAFAGTGIIGGLLFLYVCAVTGIRALFNIYRYIGGVEWSAKLVLSVVALELLVGAFVEAGIFDRLSPVSLLMLLCVVIINAKELR